MRWAVGDREYYVWKDYQAAHAADLDKPFYAVVSPPFHSGFYKSTSNLWLVLKNFGEPWMIAIIAVFVGVYDRRRWLMAGAFVAAVSLAGGLAALIRIIDGRYRPTHIDGATHWALFRGLHDGTDLAFPSGHATVAFATAAVLSYLSPRGRFFSARWPRGRRSPGSSRGRTSTATRCSGRPWAGRSDGPPSACWTWLWGRGGANTPRGARRWSVESRMREESSRRPGRRGGFRLALAADRMSTILGHAGDHMFRSVPVLALILGALGAAALAQQTASAPATGTRPAGRAYGPETLPGKGLAEHDFLFAGESCAAEDLDCQGRQDRLDLYASQAARGGGEISDATLLSNGNILFAFQFGAAMVTPDKKVVWSVEAAAPTEIHTAVPVGLDKVAYIVNGNPARLIVASISGKPPEFSFELPTANPNSIHGQFRHLRYTAAGTFLVAHMDANKVVEYDKDGKSLWSVAVESPWAAVRLKNGDTLITSNRNFVREVNQKGESVWEFKAADAPEYRIWGTQTAARLANGNTIINNWHGKDAGGEPVQFLEVTPENKVVWALRVDRAEQSRHIHEHPTARRTRPSRNGRTAALE